SLATPLAVAGGLLPGKPGAMADRRAPGPPFLPPVWDVPWAAVFLCTTAPGHPGNPRGPWSLLRAYQRLGRVALPAGYGLAYLHPVDDTRSGFLLRAPYGPNQSGARRAHCRAAGGPARPRSGPSAGC